METVLNVLLIRFGIIAGVVVVLGLAVFAAVVALRRRGKGEWVRAGAKTVARAMGERGGGRVAREAVRWLEDDRGRDAR
ncbi:hypothetical protein [Amycolatopsis panacis]|uniref:Uncharacterized protein n=1 Tax=Amycolatopsis panacis TaxID=2340917 RepID=A0A419I5P9_9PSEU|nr:hypothetical protein [Amycolatopsis panacis]RJQ86269.1 hypothetical protein D5S19_12045 [Amycolatopsis panacis]